MKKLFLIDGAAGFAKNDLLSFINQNENAHIVRKNTTRAPRDYEKDQDYRKNKTDLDFLSSEEFSEFEESEKTMYGQAYCYNYGESYDIKNDSLGIGRYGIARKELNDAIDKHENVFVIVRSAECISRMKNDYCRKVKVITILIYGLGVKTQLSCL